VCYRLGDRARANGFLACLDAEYQAAFGAIAAEARRLARGAILDRSDLAAFEERVAAAIAPMNVAGFCDHRRRNWYPVEFSALLDSAPKLGRSREELVAFLHAQGMDRWLDRSRD
jgi:hypothetical protein